jgi:hypothetical protein
MTTLKTQMKTMTMMATMNPKTLADWLSMMVLIKSAVLLL